jgi:CRISPR-associated endonuclease Csn1
MIKRRTVTDEGKARINKSYSLYIDRAMIEAEFDALWAKQSELNPVLFSEKARVELRDALLFQRKLRPVKPGRCTLMPDEYRAPLALPSTQRFRILQEVNNLRIVAEGLRETPLTPAQRDALVLALEHNGKRTFPQLRKAAGLPSNAVFNLEDEKRSELKGNAANAILGRVDRFGERWYELDRADQDEIVMQLVTEESEANLSAWLKARFDLDDKTVEAISNVSLPEGYGSLSRAALERILPALEQDVIPYSDAVRLAGFEHQWL